MSPLPLGTQDQDPLLLPKTWRGQGGGMALTLKEQMQEGGARALLPKASSQLSSHWQGHQAPLGVSPALCP